MRFRLHGIVGIGDGIRRNNGSTSQTSQITSESCMSHVSNGGRHSELHKDE